MLRYLTGEDRPLMLGNRHQSRVDVAGSLERLRDGLDRSNAMSLIRSVIGRPLDLADPRPFPPTLTGEEPAPTPDETPEPTPEPTPDLLAS